MGHNGGLDEDLLLDVAWSLACVGLEFRVFVIVKSYPVVCKVLIVH